MTTFSERHRDVIDVRLRRLVRMMMIGAPLPMLEAEGALAIRTIVYAFGPGVMAALGKHLIIAEKERNGLCPNPDHVDEDKPISAKKTPHGDSWGMCDECLSMCERDDEEAGRIEEEVQG